MARKQRSKESIKIETLTHGEASRRKHPHGRARGGDGGGRPQPGPGRLCAPQPGPRPATRLARQGPAGLGRSGGAGGEIRSDGPDDIACWFVDTDYNEESFSVRHAYFLGANDPYQALKTTLKAEIDHDAWATLHSDRSRPFDRPASGRIAVKAINHLGDEVMKVFRV